MLNASDIEAMGRDTIMYRVAYELRVTAKRLREEADKLDGPDMDSEADAAVLEQTAIILDDRATAIDEVRITPYSKEID